MSEAPSDNALPPRDAFLPPPVEPSPPVSTKGRGNGLTLLALVIGAAGVALAGWGAWQVQALELRDRQQFTELAALREQNQGLSQRAQGLSETLAQLPSVDELAERRRLLASLQGDQQRLSQRLETVLGASRQDWRLAEAEHLLRLASLRLSALQDINSARALVQGADEILREQDDPAAFAAREQLAKSLEALRSVTQPDRTGLFLQLGALRQQVVQLDVQ
ncbi:MAG TPA: uroporphyrinogen-III C-methyltransferase, partial [Pseudomonas sp.]|nr:uroporphyrinogen-III C-methyltransferase [Pseudomonas sp.]